MHQTHLSVSCKHVTRIMASSCCCCVPLSVGTHLKPHHVPMGSDSEDYQSLATLVKVDIASFAKQRDAHDDYSYLSRTRTAAVCDVSLLMHEIDGSEGEDNPPIVKRTSRAFHALPTKLHLRVR